jgi:hypothetical protein
MTNLSPATERGHGLPARFRVFPLAPWPTWAYLLSVDTAAGSIVLGLISHRALRGVALGLAGGTLRALWPRAGIRLEARLTDAVRAAFAALVDALEARNWQSPARALLLGGED